MFLVYLNLIDLVEARLSFCTEIAQRHGQETLKGTEWASVAFDVIFRKVIFHQSFNYVIQNDHF